jgi:hypothetical protein
MDLFNERIPERAIYDITKTGKAANLSITNKAMQ